MASDEFGSSKEGTGELATASSIKKGVRSTMQVGDPFMGKLLLEACLKGGIAAQLSAKLLARALKLILRRGIRGGNGRPPRERAKEAAGKTPFPRRGDAVDFTLRCPDGS